MPRGTAFDLEVFKTLKATEIKKEGEETVTVWTPETGKRFRLCGFVFYGSTETNLSLLDEGTVFFVTASAAKIAVPIVFPQGGYLSVKAGNKLKLNLSATNATASYTFYGVEDIA
jgi:hypothetical protein